MCMAYKQEGWATLCSSRNNFPFLICDICCDLVHNWFDTPQIAFWLTPCLVVVVVELYTNDETFVRSDYMAVTGYHDTKILHIACTFLLKKSNAFLFEQGQISVLSTRNTCMSFYIITECFTALLLDNCSSTIVIQQWSSDATRVQPGRRFLRKKLFIPWFCLWTTSSDM